MAPADVLVVMARQPTPGAVKTRLAARVGGSAACALYRGFLADLAATLGDGPWRLSWAVTPPDADLRPIVGATDLGARMRHCFADLFAGGAGRVVMIGADAPHLGRERVAAAFAALDEADVVLTPTRDGGYCLVGQQADRDVFSGIAMGGPHVFAQTIRRIAALGLRPSIQPGTFDVDDWDDLVLLDKLLKDGAVDLPATAAALAALR
jgi:rSAM/selenodomain-associated transferase 1